MRTFPRALAALAVIAAAAFGLLVAGPGNVPDASACEPTLSTTRFVENGKLTEAQFHITAPCVDELAHADGRPMQLLCKNSGTMTYLRDNPRDFAVTLAPTGPDPIKIRCQVSGELDGQAVSWELSAAVKPR